ncbi:hypothetical protein IKF12_01590 [Candidatus Saccharibacteria bacterium]|nr:hypothetical protein [Candidatus Saccharibacteria bacterium]
MKSRKGIIKPNGVSLEKHEYDTVLFLTTLGYDITLIPPSHVPNIKTPDFIMNKIKWEMKSPKGENRSTFEHAFQAALKQSANVIFDLRRTHMLDSKAIKILEQLYGHSKSIRRLVIITKRQKLLEYKK